VEHHDAAAAQPAHLRINDTLNKRAGESGINRVATALQCIGARFHGQWLRRADNSR
jgi:hypothetical protein